MHLFVCMYLVLGSFVTGVDSYDHIQIQNVYHKALYSHLFIATVTSFPTLISNPWQLLICCPSL